jgi:hypothetical protein
VLGLLRKLGEPVLGVPRKLVEGALLRVDGLPLG